MLTRLSDDLLVSDYHSDCSENFEYIPSISSYISDPEEVEPEIIEIPKTEPTLGKRIRTMKDRSTKKIKATGV